MKNSMKKLLVCVLVMMIAAGQSGCAIVSDEGGTEGKNGRTELVLWTYYETEMQKKSMDELVAGFNKSQEEYHLTWEYHGPVTEFNKKLAIAMTQNQLPDMVILDNPDMPLYISMDKLEDMTDIIVDLDNLDQYFPVAMESVKYGEKYYGLPFCCNNIVLVYNKDMLAEKDIDVPRSWQDLWDAAEKLTDSDHYGFAMSAVDGEQGVFQFGTLMLSAGDSLEQAGGTGTLEAFRFVRDLTEQGWMSRDCVNWSQNDVARIFIEGKCAMMENGPWVFPALDESDINYGIAVFPAIGQSRGFLGGENIAVIKGKNIEGCEAFLQYYSQPDTMLNINLCASSLPPRMDAAQFFLKAKPQYAVILEQMEHCISRTSVDNWSELSEQLSDAQYRIMIGESTPEQVCEEIRNQRP